MRNVNVLGFVAACAPTLVALTVTSSSQAGDESLVQASCSGGAVTITAASPWHTNKAAPWKWDKGEKVSVDDHAAKFKGAACGGTVKAFICNGDQCKGPISVAIK